MPEAPNSHWDRVMERRGVENVRLLLASTGPSENAVVKGLGDAIEDWPTRKYVEGWIAQKDVEQQARQDWWTRINFAIALTGAAAAVIGALAAIVAAVEGWSTVR